MTGLSLLRAMQFSDSGFPSGVFAFSWGLESALVEGQVDGRSLRGWVAAELRGRWHPFDRVALAGGFRRAGGDLADWDRIVDESIAADRARLQSLEAGAALLASARAIGIATDSALVPGRSGHLPVVQGNVLAAAGLSLAEALAVSAGNVARGAFSAAVRLGRTGAIGMQKDLLALLPLLGRLADDVPPEGALPSTFAPLSEIALMRPPSTRLFVN